MTDSFDFDDVYRRMFRDVLKPLRRHFVETIDLSAAFKPYRSIDLGLKRVLEQAMEPTRKMMREVAISGIAHPVEMPNLVLPRVEIPIELAASMRDQLAATTDVLLDGYPESVINAAKAATNVASTWTPQQWEAAEESTGEVAASLKLPDHLKESARSATDQLLEVLRKGVSRPEVLVVLTLWAVATIFGASNLADDQAKDLLILGVVLLLGVSGAYKRL